jgi:hypothetical protein
MPFTGGANIRTADDLAWLDKKLDGFVGNIRATAATRGLRGNVCFGGKAVVGWSRINVRF